MAIKPTAPRVMSGTYGMLYWDGEPVFEVSSFEATLKVNRETVNMAGEIMEDSKLTGIAGEFNFKVNKVFSRGQIKLTPQRANTVIWNQTHRSVLTAVMCGRIYLITLSHGVKVSV